MDTDEVDKTELADFRRDRATSPTPAKPSPPPAPRFKAAPNLDTPADPASASAPCPRPAFVPCYPTEPNPTPPDEPPPRSSAAPPADVPPQRLSAPPTRPPPMRSQPRMVPTIPRDARFSQAFTPPRHPDLFNPQAQAQQSFHVHYENLILAMQAQLAEHIAETVD